MNKLIILLLTMGTLVGCHQDEANEDVVVYSGTLSDDMRVWCVSGKLHYGGKTLGEKPLQPVLIGTKESPRSVTCKEQ